MERRVSRPCACSHESALTCCPPSRCIFLELFERRPVFQGLDEINQLDAIFAVTGTPDPETWPAVSELPWYELVKPRAKLPSKLREMFSK